MLKSKKKPKSLRKMIATAINYKMKLVIYCLIGIVLVSPVLAKETVNSVKKSEPIAGVLERVIDGDTFVSFGKKIRLWGIDAPEKGDAHYLSSKLYLEVILEKEPFSCYYKDKDKYQRLVMQCFSRGEDIARMMVQRGLARDYFRYSKGEYSSEESFAKDNAYGIWAK